MGPEKGPKGDPGAQDARIQSPGEPGSLDVNEPRKSFGYWLRRRRKVLDLTQEALAEQVSCSRFAIKKIEADERRPSRHLAERLADKLGIARDERAAFLAAARGERGVVGRDPVPLSPAGGTALSPVPPPRTGFLGREKELETGLRLLRAVGTRLLTLSGPGGVGKTRLAQRLAQSAAADFADGTCYVELAPVPSAELVLPAIAKALGAPEVAGLSVADTLVNQLAARRLLLVLDNFEHVLDAAPAVADVLARSAHLRILVTSREPLRISFEQQMDVPPFTVPDPLQAPSDTEQLLRYEAVRLFVERASAVKPDFRLTKENANVIGHICRRLDGLPLAIELAAARVGLLAPAAMLARLDRRLFMLTGGPKDAPPRQQTMRQAVAWSHELLNDEDRRAFRRLAAFTGSFTLAAAEVLAADPDVPQDMLERMASLVDKSLLRQTDDSVEEEPRFSMLETVREFADECLARAGEVEDVRARHARFYIGLAEQAEPGLSGPFQASWLHRLQQEHDNLRSALQWLTRAGRVDEALQLAAGLRRYFRARGYVSEARERLAELLEAAGTASNSVRAKGLHAAGWLAREQGDYPEGCTLLERSLDLYRALDEPRGMGWSLVDLAFIKRYQGDYRRATALLQEALPLLRRARDQEGLAAAEGNLGMIARDEGNHTAAQAHLQASLALWQQIDDRVGIGWALTALGMVLRAAEQHTAACTCLERALALWKELGDRQNTANVLNTMAAAARADGRYEDCALLLEQSIAIVRELGDRRALAFVLEGFAELAALQSHAQRALTLASAAQTIRDRIGAPRPPDWRERLERALERACAPLRAEIAAEATFRGAQMSVEAAVAMALADVPPESKSARAE